MVVKIVCDISAR